MVLGGSIMPVHDLLTIQYLTNGMIDSDFGDNGIVITDFNGKNDFARTIALQGDGKIIVGGYSSSDDNNSSWDFAAARYQIDGTLDQTFGTNGKVKTSILQYNNGESLTIQPDGKIIFAGYVSAVSPNSAIGMIRYLANGNLDFSFGVDGKVIINLGDQFYSFGYCTALQSDGKILVAGHTRFDSTFTDFTLLRFLAEEEVATFSPLGLGKKFQISPNPTSGTISIQMAQNEFSTIAFRLNNTMGDQIVAFEKRPILAGESKFELPIPNLPPGVYYLTSLVDGKVWDTQEVILK